MRKAAVVLLAVILLLGVLWSGMAAAGQPAAPGYGGASRSPSGHGGGEML